MKNMPDFNSIDEYLESIPVEVKEKLIKIRKIIKEVAPEAEEAIRYGIPTFRLNDKNLVHFAGFKNHIGFYPTPSGITKFEKELAPYVKSKGTIQFPLDKPVPYELINKIVKYRVRENLAKKE